MLLVVGFSLLASAGEAMGLRLHNSATYFVTHQAVWLGVATLFMLAAAIFDYHNWRRYSTLTIVVYCVIVLLMIAVLFAPETKGSHRWLRLFGPVRLQPSELGKIFVVISTAVKLVIMPALVMILPLIWGWTDKTFAAVFLCFIE